jgi:glycerophosphoryl diester phosphodiesterase
VTPRWPYPRVLAHRGAGSLAPENTLAAIRAGLGFGFRAVEFDVMLSEDEIPVLMHDPEFGRTLPGRGEVSKTPVSELVKMDAGSWFDARFAREPVPLLSSVMEFCRSEGIFMNIEIKPARGTDRRTGEVVGLALAHFLADPACDAPSVLFSSFSTTALEGARATAPAVPRGHLFSRIPYDWQNRLKALDCRALHCDHRNLDQTLAKRVSAAGFGLFCYTVNELSRGRELFDWGVDALCTDRIDLFRPDFA